jgi:hypothetical protein
MVSVEGLLLGCMVLFCLLCFGVCFVCFVWYLFVLCMLSPCWPRILFGFRFLAVWYCAHRHFPFNKFQFQNFVINMNDKSKPPLLDYINSKAFSYIFRCLPREGL